MSDTMYVVVYCNEGPDQGVVYLSRALADDEIMCARKFADDIAAQYDRTIAESSGYIQNCFGDLRVEFLSHEPRIEHDRDDQARYQGGSVIWDGQSFYFASEES